MKKNMEEKTKKTENFLKVARDKFCQKNFHFKKNHAHQ